MESGRMKISTHTGPLWIGHLFSILSYDTEKDQLTCLKLNILQTVYIIALDIIMIFCFILYLFILNLFSPVPV